MRSDPAGYAKACSLKGEKAMAMMTGEQYVESMRKMNLQVYMFGKRLRIRWMIPFSAPL